MPNRIKLDIDKYKKIAGKECFICNIVNGGDKRDEHVIIDENEHFIAFLNNYPTEAGHSLVCPKKHIRHIFKDLDDSQYIEFLKYAKKIGSAIQDALSPDRMYLVSVGSNELNDHVHFHLFPLPVNTPFDEQQFAALDHNKKPILNFSREEKEELADKIRNKIN